MHAVSGDLGHLCRKTSLHDRYSIWNITRDVCVRLLCCLECHLRHLLWAHGTVSVWAENS